MMTVTVSWHSAPQTHASGTDWGTEFLCQSAQTKAGVNANHCYLLTMWVPLHASFFCQAHLCGAFIQKYPSIHYNIPFTLFYILTVRQSISYLTTEAEQDPILDIKIILIINCIIICAYGTNSIQYEICLAGMLHVLCCHHCIRPSVTAEHFEPTLDGALWKSLLLLLL